MLPARLIVIALFALTLSVATAGAARTAHSPITSAKGAGKRTPTPTPTPTPEPTPEPTPDPAPDPTPTPEPGAKPLFGFNDGAMRRHQITPIQGAELFQEAGATTVRIVFDWKNAEQTRGELVLDMYDAIYKRSLARGIRPLFHILFSPKWSWDDAVRDCASDCRFPPSEAFDADWRRLVTTLVTRYPQMAALEIWNEPNLNYFWGTGIDPQRYVRLVRSADEAAAAAGSPIPILGGSPAPVEETTATAMESVEFLRQAWASGLGDHVDGLSVHPYPHDIDDGRFHKHLTEARTITGGTVPLWVTEFGVSTTGGYTERQQAAIITRLKRKLEAESDVRAITPHTSLDVTLYQPTSSAYGFGLMRADLTPKLAWCALSAEAALRPGCPETLDISVSADQQARWAAQDLLEDAIDAAVAYRAATGGFPGLTTDYLSSATGTVSATPQDPAAMPGPDADPRRIFLYTEAGKPNKVLLCNTSHSNLSYCAMTWDNNERWIYRSAPGSINAAAGAVTTTLMSKW